MPGLDPAFADQRERVLQILRDWKNAYSSGRSSVVGEDAVPFIERSNIGGGSWPLNAEVERRRGDSRVARSFRLVEDELEWMKTFMPYAYRPLREVFLKDDAGDRDYEHLKAKAQGGSERAKALLDRVEVALYVLTKRLMGKELYAVFGERVIRKTHRRQTMEESYREIHRVFEEWCSELGRKHKRYRNKAYENTAVQLGVAKSTVERAVHFVEAGKVERAS